jgi:membrane protease subunit HflC
MKRGVIVGAIGLVALVLLASSAYTVDMREQAIITQFGEPVGEPVTEPGLHFKLPLIQTVNRLDKRWLEWDGEVDEMRTAEKTPIIVDTYARWRIRDPLKFFKALRAERIAQSRIDDIIEPETRNAVAAHKLIEVVRSTDRPLPPSAASMALQESDDAELQADAVLSAPEAEAEAAKAPAQGAKAPLAAEAPGLQTGINERIEQGRAKLQATILERVSPTLSDLGIEVVDVRFKRVNYTPPVEQQNFERMISERKAVADKYRSEGRGASARINGEMTRKLKQIESEAYRQVQEIKGSADANATEIYARAHNKDPELFRLQKSLEAYAQTIDQNTWVILSTDADFYQVLKRTDERGKR